MKIWREEKKRNSIERQKCVSRVKETGGMGGCAQTKTKLALVYFTANTLEEKMRSRDNKYVTLTV